MISNTNNLTVNDEYRINLNINITGLSNSLIVDNGIIIQKTILIFGKTGAGKSSILNSITNSSSKIFTEGESNSSETQETKAVIHKLFNNGMNCLFIDSPGLFDSEKKDTENMKKMSKFIQKSGYSIIIFAYSILEPKIDHSFYITLEMLTEIFGESVMSRVYFVLTHLNDLNPNKKESKINLIKSDFNKLVKNNKNELLFFDYENSSNDNFGLSQLENILKSYTTLQIPISREENSIYDLLQKKEKVLNLEQTMLTGDFNSENDKYLIFVNNKQIEVTKKENAKKDEILKYQITIEKSIQDNRIFKQQAVNNYQFIKQNEFNGYQTEMANFKAQKQREFLTLGGSYIEENYTISGVNAQQQLNLYNVIVGIPGQIKAKADAVNSDVQTCLANINQEIQNFIAQSQTDLDNKDTQLNNQLQLFLNEKQKEIDIETAKMGNLEVEISKKLKNLNIRTLEVNSELNYFQFKKTNSNFSIVIRNGEGNNYCIVNNIVKIDALEKLEMSKFCDFAFKNLSGSKNFSFDAMYSKNYFTFTNSDKKAAFKNKSDVKLLDTDYNLYPVAKIDIPIKKKFIVKFRIEGYGWFGVGNSLLKPDGFPGYTDNGWMVCTDGRIFHNNSLIYNLGIFSHSTEAYFECDVENKMIGLFCEGNHNRVNIMSIPDEVYFVISIAEGSHVELLEFYN